MLIKWAIVAVLLLHGDTLSRNRDDLGGRASNLTLSRNRDNPWKWIGKFGHEVGRLGHELGETVSKLVNNEEKATSIPRRGGGHSVAPLAQPQVQPESYFGDFPDFIGKKVSLARHPHAQCLDGSPGAFYINRDGASKSKYYIFKQGGGMCGHVEGCVRRAQSELGSSNHAMWASTLNMKQPGSFPHVGFSRNPADNPLMHDWTYVYVVYCDGSYYSGSNMTITSVKTGRKKTQLHFKGSHIMEAVINELADNYGMSQATDVVLAGCSAGGISTVASRDWVKSIVVQRAPSARFVGMSCSGFFLDYDYKRSRYASKKHFIFHQANGSRVLNPECVAAYKEEGNEHKCLVAQLSAHFSKTPLFLWESLFDTYMLKHVLEGPCHAAECANEHGENMRAALYNLWHMHPDFGGFLSGCNHHCEDFGKGSDIANMKPVDGLLPMQAFYCWYKRLERKQPMGVTGLLKSALPQSDPLCKDPEQRYWTIPQTDYATHLLSCPAGPKTQYNPNFDAFE